MAAVTSAVVGGVAAVSSIQSGRKAAKAGERQAAASEAAAQEQAAIERERLELSREAQEWAKEDRARAKETFQPLEDDLINESKNLGSIANQNKVAGQAAADVASTFAAARERLNTVPGANPSQQVALQERNKINLAEAATSAAAQTGARQLARDKGRAALIDASGLGRGLISNASSGLSSAGSGMGSVASGMGAAANYYANRSATSSQDGAVGIGQGARAIGGILNNKAVQDWWAGSSPVVSSGSSGFGSGAAYGNQDLGQNF